MTKMESDLCQLLYAAATNNITEEDVKSVKWSEEPAVNVVLAAKGYPGSYLKAMRSKIYKARRNRRRKRKSFTLNGEWRERGDISERWSSFGDYCDGFVRKECYEERIRGHR